MEIKTKRIYEDPAKDDGYRILIDRIWPRGVSKEKAQLDDWPKDIAPSDELRKWFDHDPDKFDEFAQKYCIELRDKEKELDEIRKKAKDKTLSLLYGAKDEKNNQAVILRKILQDRNGR